MRLNKICLLILLVSCGKSYSKPQGSNNINNLELQCQYVSNYVKRCENSEVICYIMPSKGGVFCKFKENKNDK
jgi:hypothetical protein